jgi:hypothetical protein
VECSTYTFFNHFQGKNNRSFRNIFEIDKLGDIYKCGQTIDILYTLDSASSYSAIQKLKS